MDRVAGLIVRRSKVVLGLTAIITLVSLLMLFRVAFNADASSFLLEGNATGEEFAALQQKYATKDPINVVATAPDGTTFADADQLALVVSLRDELSSVAGVVAVASIIPEVNPRTGGPIDAATVLALPDSAIGLLVDQNPLAEIMVSADGRHTLLIVTPGEDATATARLVDDVSVDGLELTFSGNPVVFAAVFDLLSLFLLLIPPLVIALLIGTFFATIGDLRLSALAIVPAALGSIWTFGLIFALGREIDIVTVIVPIFVIVMGSADGLHFVTHFQEESGRTADPVVRTSSALSQVGVPMILTTISTAAGFIALLFTDVRPIQQLGLFTAIGITFAGVVSFFSLPALVSHLDVKPRHRGALLGMRATRAVKVAVRTRVPAVVLVVGIAVFAVVTIPGLAVNADQLFFFKDDDPMRIAFEKTEELFGGATPLAGEFAFDPADPNASIAVAAALSAEMEELPGVRAVFSAADLVGAVPLEALVAGDVAVPVGDLVSADGLRFILLPSAFSSDDLATWLAFAEARPEITVLTGMPVVWDEIARLVLRAQATSVIVAYVLVAAMLALAYRRLRETVVSLVPITLTIVAVLGFIAASGIQLNLLTAVISSIVIGVGIDYAIHFVAAIDHARKDGDGYVLRAVDKAGRPIIANALGISVALSALWLSPLKIHAQVSMIMWIAMVTAAATSLVVIPALLPRRGVKPVPEPRERAAQT